MPVTGRILRIEKLSTFDGEGLRTVVFLKGCPLSCQWCSTPESQRSAVDFGVTRSKCTGCFACVEACPENALIWNIKSERFDTDTDRCRECLNCITACPNAARQSWGYDATVDEILHEIQKDSLFYFHSGGGVTLSGGEPLIQADFVAELMEKCLGLGISTAIETSGQAPFSNFEKVLPYTDTLFFDLKHMDDQAHSAATGVGNKRILENLKQIDTSCAHLSIIVRMPVIPGLNDGMESVRALGEFCLGLVNLSQIQLLPYHRLGVETYNRMAIPYGLETLASVNPEELEMYTEALTHMGLNAAIGG